MECVANYHQTSGRRDLKSTVNAAMKVKLKGHQVEDISLIFNGLGKDIIRKAIKTESILRDKYAPLQEYWQLHYFCDSTRNL